MVFILFPKNRTGRSRHNVHLKTADAKATPNDRLTREIHPFSPLTQPQNAPCILFRLVRRRYMPTQPNILWTHHSGRDRASIVPTGLKNNILRRLDALLGRHCDVIHNGFHVTRSCHIRTCTGKRQTAPHRIDSASETRGAGLGELTATGQPCRKWQTFREGEQPALGPAAQVPFPAGRRFLTAPDPHVGAPPIESQTASQHDQAHRAV